MSVCACVHVRVSPMPVGQAGRQTGVTLEVSGSFVSVLLTEGLILGGGWECSFLSRYIISLSRRLVCSSMSRLRRTGSS